MCLRFELPLPLLAGEPWARGRDERCSPEEAGVVVVDVDVMDGADEVLKKAWLTGLAVVLS